MLHLLYDQGNTRTKCVAVLDGARVDPGVSQARADAALWCSVADTMGRAERMAWLLERARRAWILDRHTPSPLVIPPGTQPMLGADRIAAAAGALATAPGVDILVVDAGTCVTYDHVSARGVFMGGNIGPGVEMQLRAMHHHTARLPLAALEPRRGGVFGHDTPSALSLGVANGIAGAAALCWQALPEPRACLLTGGDARALSPYFTIPHALAPGLVMDGLETILQHLENET